MRPSAAEDPGRSSASPTPPDQRDDGDRADRDHGEFLLDYHRQILRDLAQDVPELAPETPQEATEDRGDGLVVVARGLGVQRLLLTLLHVYSDPKGLVFLLNTPAAEAAALQTGLLRLCAASDPASSGRHALRHFHVVDASTGAAERQVAYAGGGVFCTSARILIVDLLRGRVPLEFVSGVIVNHAHAVTETSMEAFILRKYREGNRTGFIKALSDVPTALTQGFARLEKTLKFLRLRHVYLWPRFHVVVQDELAGAGAISVAELRVSQSAQMQAVQDGLVACIDATLGELRRGGAVDDTTTLEDAFLRSFEVQVAQRLEPQWHRVGARTRQALQDLRELRQLLDYLLAYDPVAFYAYLETLLEASARLSAASGSGGSGGSAWLLQDGAHTAFVAARERAFPTGGAAPETPPKWAALATLVHEELRGVRGPILVMCASARSCRQVREFLSHGQEVLRRSARGYFVHRRALSVIKDMRVVPSRGGGRGGGRGAAPPNKRRRVRGGAAGVAAAAPAVEPGPGEAAAGVDPVPEGVENVALDAFFRVLPLEPLPTEAAPESCAAPIVVATFRGSAADAHGSDEDDLQQLLDLEPSHIICFDSDVGFVRTVELFHAMRPGPLKVFQLLYAKSVEEQKFLATVRKEKDAFERLIRERGIMAVPLDQDGRLVVDEPEERFWARLGTRDGSTGNDAPSVVVDMREFRSALPSLCDRRGMRVLPVTLEVGDYVLTRTMAVERKSVSDLIGSFRSGRLYTQIEQLSLHYAAPVLLIEFEADRPFALAASADLRSDVSLADLQSKLVLLAISFPQLRILWSSSPRASADLFYQLKRGQPEPDEAAAAAVGSAGAAVAGAAGASDAMVLYHPTLVEMLRAMPGVTPRVLRILLNRVSNLASLVGLSSSDLAEMIGAEAARALYAFLHQRASPTS